MHIVIRKDGQVEKYGYAGGPAFEDMEKKYGLLPEMMKPLSANGNKGYYARWGSISTEAAKAFHTTNPTVRHIIFPGDSRVIVVPVSGEPAIYDMDNADPKERPAFERAYGKLPDCVPAPSRGGVAPVAREDTGRKAPFDPHDISIGVKKGEFYIGLRNGAVGDDTRMLFVVDGVPAHFDRQRLTMQSVYAVHVFSQARARALYGDKSENGVVAITTRNSMKWDTAAWGGYRSHGTLASGPDTVYTYWHL